MAIRFVDLEDRVPMVLVAPNTAPNMITAPNTAPNKTSNRHDPVKHRIYMRAYMARRRAAARSGSTQQARHGVGTP